MTPAPSRASCGWVFRSLLVSDERPGQVEYLARKHSAEAPRQAGRRGLHGRVPGVIRIRLRDRNNFLRRRQLDLELSAAIEKKAIRLSWKVFFATICSGACERGGARRSQQFFRVFPDVPFVEDRVASNKQ